MAAADIPVGQEAVRRWVEWIIGQAKSYDVFTAFFERRPIDAAHRPVS